MAQECSVQAQLQFYAIQIKTSDSSPSRASQEMGLFSHDIMVETDGRIERRATNWLLALVLHAGAIALLTTLSIWSPVPVRLIPWTHLMLTVPAAVLKARVAPIVRPRSVLPIERALPPVQLAPPISSAQFNPSESAPPIEAFRSESSADILGIGIMVGGIPNDLPAPSVSPVVSQRLRFLQHGGDVKNSHPMHELIVAYPQFARMARVVGKVVIQAMIDEKGKVMNARAVSGPPLLYSAALDAVSQERFAPVLLNDEPIKCDLQVQVSFKLNDPSF